MMVVSQQLLSMHVAYTEVDVGMNMHMHATFILYLVTNLPSFGPGLSSTSPERINCKSITDAVL